MHSELHSPAVNHPGAELHSPAVNHPGAELHSPVVNHPGAENLLTRLLPFTCPLHFPLQGEHGL